MNNNLIYWSPAYQWKIQTDGKLKIGKYIYPAEYGSYFPKLYFITQDGASPELILAEYPDIKTDKLIKDLVKRKILVNQVLPPNDLFAPQKKLCQHEYQPDYFLDPLHLEQFQQEQINRNYPLLDKLKYSLAEAPAIHPLLMTRKTHRKYSNRKISFTKLSNILSVFGHKKSCNDQANSYTYASAGGLYPIDVYIYVKKGRVEMIEEGLYYYSPLDNTLNLIDQYFRMTEDAHYGINKEIFNSSAFSVFFVYHSASNIPKYGGMGYFYAIIDTGIMIASYNLQCEYQNIGICCIGDMKYQKIAKKFGLSSDQIFLQCVECGLKMEESKT